MINAWESRVTLFMCDIYWVYDGFMTADWTEAEGCVFQVVGAHRHEGDNT